MIKKIFLFSGLLTTLFSFSQKSENITVLNYEEFKESIVGKDVQLIDLRTDKEYTAGFIEDAIQMDFFKKEKFANQISTLKKEKPVYVYCHSGGRSGKASKLLLKKGFVKIYDFSGGYTSWVKNNKKQK